MKSFRKTICLAVAIIFAFAPVVSAADICGSCKAPKNELIYYYNMTQGQAVAPITYEREGGTRSGYLANSNGANARLIFRVCNCENTATNFQLNRIIGIQLTMVTEGVYFTNEPIAIQPTPSDAAVCAAGNPNVNYEILDDGMTDGYKQGDIVMNTNSRKGTTVLPRTAIVDNALIPAPGYVNQTSNIGPALEATAGDQGTAGSMTDGVIGYLSTLAKYRTNGNLANPYVGVSVTAGGKRTDQIVDYEYYLDTALTNEVSSINVIAPGDPVKTTVPVSQRVKVVRVKNAYQIGTLDQEYSLSYWWVDLPEMRIDTNVVKPLDELKIKIDLLSDTLGGVCVDCKTICSCDYTLGIFGSDKFTMYFPYVLTQSQPWTSGVALTNLDVTGMPIDDMEATFTLTDGTGKAFTYKKNDFETSSWSTMLDGILDKFSGTPAAGAAWLKVETNFMADGYEFMSDGVFGAGTQPRIPDSYRDIR